MRVMLARAAVAAVAILTAGAGCASEHPRLVSAGEGFPFWLSIYNHKAGVPYAMVDEFRVCLDRPGSVTIVDVDVEYNIGGMRVDGFAVRRYQDDRPAADEDALELWEYGYESGAAEVDLSCDEEPPPNDHFQLAVQFSKPTDETARVANLLVTYQSGDRTYTFKDEFQLILCETDDGDGECASWELDEYEKVSGS